MISWNPLEYAPNVGIPKPFNQALALPSPTHTVIFVHRWWIKPNLELQKGALFCWLFNACCNQNFLYQIKSDMCTKHWPKKRWMGFFPSISFTCPNCSHSKLEAVDGMSTSDPVKSGIFGGWYQVPLGSHDGKQGARIMESTAMWLCYIVPFWLERKDMKNEEKFEKDWRNWWTSSCISE